MHLIVGTAGHIDHGKTALVRALTGTDTDRLPEEKQRGITIDLGFAELDAADVRISFVDVPGHERFVKNMLAGASGIDLVMLVVAADEGVMPQTREHFDICRLLKIRGGAVVITKKDLVDEEMLELVRMDIAELVNGSFLKDAPVFAVSSRTGDGIGELRDGLAAAARTLAVGRPDLVTRLPIDRSFTVKGFGTVVTGTLASGSISEGSELEILPTGARVRVRGIQTHGKTVGETDAGRRTAVNLGGIDHSEVSRGMLLAEPGSLRPAQVFDSEIEVLADAADAVRSRQRVRLHIGTAEVLTRLVVLNDERELQPGASGFVQLRLESPVSAVPGERFIVRSYSPQITIAGGSIVKTGPKRHRRRDLAEAAAALREIAGAIGNAERHIQLLAGFAGENGIDRRELQHVTGISGRTLDAALQKNIAAGSITDAGGVFVTRDVMDALKARSLAAIGDHHKADPLSRGLSREALREHVFKYLRPEILKAAVDGLQAAGKISADRDVLRLSGFGADLSPEEKKVHDNIERQYRSYGLQAPKTAEALSEAARGTSVNAASVRKIFQIILDSGRIAAIGDEYHVSSSVLGELIEKLRARADRTIDVGVFKDLAGVSRKYAIPLLEYLDREKVTVRSGDKRTII